MASLDGEPPAGFAPNSLVEMDESPHCSFTTVVEPKVNAEGRKEMPLDNCIEMELSR